MRVSLSLVKNLRRSALGQLKATTGIAFVKDDMRQLWVIEVNQLSASIGYRRSDVCKAGRNFDVSLTLPDRVQ